MFKKNFWAEIFYQKFLCQLKDKPFEGLYAGFHSRPNGPVNVWWGWSALRLSAAGQTESCTPLCCDIYTRKLPGDRHLGEVYFDLRTRAIPRERHGHRFGRRDERAAYSPLPADHRNGGARRERAETGTKPPARMSGRDRFSFCPSFTAGFPTLSPAPAPGSRLVQLTLLRRTQK